ncbi:uncharacterized protein VTP21DRAFT_7083 [Calcarisporiella thermophila]|uniref:uncharacterized protein n=1 Tax=Calcarisporiella thermophila TaxID=911321 RepID=UPI0037433432
MSAKNTDPLSQPKKENSSNSPRISTERTVTTSPISFAQLPPSADDSSSTERVELEQTRHNRTQSKVSSIGSTTNTSLTSTSRVNPIPPGVRPLSPTSEDAPPDPLQKSSAQSRWSTLVNPQGQLTSETHVKGKEGPSTDTKHETHIVVPPPDPEWFRSPTPNDGDTTIEGNGIKNPTTKLQSLIEQSVSVPLIIKGLIFIFSFICMCISGNLIDLTSRFGVASVSSSSLTLMVATVAMVYLVWAAYDEHLGKPIGLRRTSTKLIIMSVDLVFVVLWTAALCTSFTVLFTTWGCATGDGFVTRSPSVDERESFARASAYLCPRLSALITFNFFSLLLWYLQFLVGLIRIFEKMRSHRK